MTLIIIIIYGKTCHHIDVNTALLYSTLANRFACPDRQQQVIYRPQVIASGMEQAA